LIPEFLECVKNVKKDKSFGLREISKKKWCFVWEIYYCIVLKASIFILLGFE
jgi:hypothetical protein